MSSTKRARNIAACTARMLQHCEHHEWHTKDNYAQTAASAAFWRKAAPRTTTDPHGTTSSCGMTLDQAQSWTSSSRCCRLRRHLHRQRSAPDLARSQPQRLHPKLERTGLVVNARRPCSRKLRLVTPQRHLPSRIRPRNPLEMNGSRPTNGRRLLRSSIKEPSDALSSTAHCRFGDHCRQKHSCVECGIDHPWHGNHWARPNFEGASMEAPPGQWSCPATVCYDGLSASAPSGRKTADSEPFTVPGWSQLTEDFTILRSHGPFFLEIFAGQAGITEAVQLMGVPALPPVDVVVSDLVSEAADVLDLAVWETSWQSLLPGWSSCSIVAPRATPSLQLAKMMEDLLHCALAMLLLVFQDSVGKTKLLFLWVICFWSERAKLVLLFLILEGISRSKTPCWASCGLRQWWTSSSTTHELWLLILINVPLGLRPRSPHVCCAQLNISRCSRYIYFVQEGTCTSLWEAKCSTPFRANWCSRPRLRRSILGLCARRSPALLTIYGKTLFMLYNLRCSWPRPLLIANAQWAPANRGSDTSRRSRLSKRSGRVISWSGVRPSLCCMWIWNLAKRSRRPWTWSTLSPSRLLWQRWKKQPSSNFGARLRWSWLSGRGCYNFGMLRQWLYCPTQWRRYGRCPIPICGVCSLALTTLPCRALVKFATSHCTRLCSWRAARWISHCLLFSCTVFRSLVRSLALVDGLPTI